MKQPENCIWLCAIHGRLVDNNNGKEFPSEVLLSYKALHEARIAREITGTYAPIGWIHEVDIVTSPIFKANAKVHLAKLTLLYGNNGVGKSALASWIAGTFDSTYLGSWRHPLSRDIDVRLAYISPQFHTLRLRATPGGDLRFWIDEKEVAYNPIGLRVFYLSEAFSFEKDDRHHLAKIIGVAPDVIERLAAEVEAFPHTKVRNLRFEVASDDVIDANELNESEPPMDLPQRLLMDVEGTAPGLSFRALSTSERQKVIMEFATAAARLSGRYIPTLLVLDCGLRTNEGWFDNYSHHLLDPENQFQTIMTVPGRDVDLDAVRWGGWEVVQFRGRAGSAELSQALKTSSG